VYSHLPAFDVTKTSSVGAYSNRNLSNNSIVVIRAILKWFDAYKTSILYKKYG